jgi:hypothetical protein
VVFEFRRFARVCEILSGDREQTVKNLGLLNNPFAPVIYRKIREPSGAPVAPSKVKIPFPAVAQLGRAPGSGRVPNKYAHLLPRILTRVFIGKSIGCALSQMISNNIVGV